MEGRREIAIRTGMTLICEQPEVWELRAEGPEPQVVGWRDAPEQPPAVPAVPEPFGGVHPEPSAWSPA